MTYTFTCYSDGSTENFGAVIRFDNVTILLDPGWSEKKSYEETLQYWSELIPQVDIVLLSQPTKECLGSYAFLYYKFLPHFHSRISVYATLPVANLGRVTTIDLYASQGLIGSCDTNIMELDDIEQAFDHLTTLKHSQMVDLKSKFDGLSFIAYNSGYAPGGSVWCISTYSEKLIYAPRWNHTKDTILNGSAILDSTGKPMSSLMRPSAVITSTAYVGSSLSYKKRVSRFKSTLNQALANNGIALIPTSIGGKFLELFVLVHDILYEHNKTSSKADVQVFLISYSRGRTLTYARSMLEWLSSSVLKTWESRDNRSPFDLGSKLKICTPAEVSNYAGAKICFVSEVESLINEMIMKVCHLEKTTVILTEKCYTDDGDVLSRMYNKWTKALKSNNMNALEGKSIAYSDSMPLRSFKPQKLSGSKLEDYKLKIDERRQERKELVEKLKKDANSSGSITGVSTTINEIGEDDDDDDVEDVLSTSLRGNGSISQQVETPVDIIIQPNTAPRLKMFPFQPGKIKKDDYGYMVDFTQFIPKDQQEESTKRADEEEEDPYELEGPRKVTKRRRRDENTGKKDNFDDISYLDALNRPVHRITSESATKIRCSLAFIDMSSLVDQRSMSIIWSALKPRKMILLAPKTAQNPEITAALSKKSMEIVEMDFNKTTEFNTTIKSLDISIDPELDQELKWQSVSDGYTVAHVVGRLVREVIYSAENRQHRQKLLLKPLKNINKIHPKASLAIGDVKLAELKRKLTQQNHIAEFKGEGTLVVDGKVAIRKISDGETVVDGTPSDLFYKVKSLVTGMLAKV